MNINEGVLCDWNNGENNLIIPKAYLLDIIFHDAEFEVKFTVDDLLNYLSSGYLECSNIITNSDLMSSLEDKLLEKEVAETICKYCNTIWYIQYDHNNKYNYLGQCI